MSVVSITVLGGSKSGAIVKAVRSRTKARMAEVMRALETETPVFEREIFDNEVEENFALVKGLLDQLEALNLSLSIEEDGVAISPKILRNIMSSSDEIGVEVRRLDDFGHSWLP